MSSVPTDTAPAPVSVTVTSPDPPGRSRKLNDVIFIPPTTVLLVWSYQGASTRTARASTSSRAKTSMSHAGAMVTVNTLEDVENGSAVRLDRGGLHGEASVVAVTPKKKQHIQK